MAMQVPSGDASVVRFVDRDPGDFPAFNLILSASAKRQHHSYSDGIRQHIFGEIL